MGLANPISGNFKTKIMGYGTLFIGLLKSVFGYSSRIWLFGNNIKKLPQLPV